MFILGATKNVFKDFQCSEAAQIYSLKMMLLKSQQNSKENICVVSLFIKYRLPAQVCLMNFVKFLRMALLIDSLWRLALNAFKQTQPPKVFLRKGVLKICSKFAGEHPCQSVISVKLQSSENTFSQEHLWVAAFVLKALRVTLVATSTKQNIIYALIMLMLRRRLLRPRI